MQEQVVGMNMMGSSSGMGHDYSGEQNHRMKAEIATHPLYEQLLSAHVACLRVATPIDQLPLIDAQLSNSHNILRTYASQHNQQHLHPHQRQELDNFLVGLYIFYIFKSRTSSLHGFIQILMDLILLQLLN